MQSPDAAQMPDRQVGARWCPVRQSGTLVDKAIEQRVHGNSAPLCFVGKPYFGLPRNLNGHPRFIAWEIPADSFVCRMAEAGGLTGSARGLPPPAPPGPQAGGFQRRGITG